MNRHLDFNRLVLFMFSLAFMVQSHALMPDCQQETQLQFERMVCKNADIKQLNEQLKTKYLNAQLMSNAPLKLLAKTQHGWRRHVELCQSTQCLQQQFSQRIDELELFTSMNQSLTQYFIRQSHPTRASYTQLQLHQLDKNRIKIEGMQYRNPNNSENHRIRYLRSYTSPDQFAQLVDLESKCRYSIERTGHLLKFSSKDAACKYFTGLYRLFD
jgi:uncharacterized protein